MWKIIGDVIEEWFSRNHVTHVTAPRGDYHEKHLTVFSEVKISVALNKITMI